MASDIGPGDWVECESTEDDDELGLILRGEVYQVSEAGSSETDPCSVCGGFEWLDVRHPPHPNEAWCVCAFRPIYRPKQSLITDLLTKAPSELEPA